MARHLGFDARVVIGFQPEYDGQHFTITGRNIHAWVEVRLTKLGWISIDPSPLDHPIGNRADTPPLRRNNTSGNDQLTPQDNNNASPPEADTPDAAIGTAPSNTRRNVLLITLGATAVLVLAGITPTAKYLRRQRRRRCTSTRRAILGAWWETTDRLREAGLPASPTHTTGETVRLAGEPPGLAQLATIVDYAAYAPDNPPHSLASEAWDAARETQRQVWAKLSRLHRATT